MMDGEDEIPVIRPPSGLYANGYTVLARAPYYLYDITMTMFTVFQHSPVPYLPQKAKRRLM